MNSNLSFKSRHRVGTSLKHAFTEFFIEYETQKLVVVHSAKFAGLLRIIQILVLVYSVIYLLIYEKGYQKEDTAVISSVTLKVKGIGYVNAPKNKTLIIDGADYIIPPSENNAIFIMTSFIQTDQTRSTCAESEKLKEAVCKSDRDCANKTFTPNMNGRWTGRCLLSPQINIVNQTTNAKKIPKGLCEYAGWCPPEDDFSSEMLVQETLNFTIFIKNFIEFSIFQVKHKNMVDNLKVPCTFHPEYAKDCPIFSIDYIMSEAEKNITERNLMLRYGGVVRIKLDWDCNLDRNIKLCKPEYSFARLDVPFYEEPFSKGFNFRHATAWKYNEEHFRTLSKAHGLRFIISVSGKAGKFDFITLTLNIGSIVGLFGLGTVICDIFLLHLSKESSIYRKHIFDDVNLGRNDSIKKVPKISVRTNDDEYSKPDLNIEAESSYRTTDNSSVSPAKTVTMGPVSFINPRQN
ncbi:unnamed protein product [Rotaria sp. Silwood1]|nr:unnamed protein product [Rotaria sp. Silwood1]CAF0888110.1 unnamed protein product [Rotaria sp. Silwood1]CAF0901979.1 unnamed protein product [Rotaria sp. Silwood1]CAF3350170.1 unnamed protein product [Rotaria sp. Silwood1]CAF3377830.1 unnamed protein product [Rotaria sp. Silwood1]